MKKRTRLVIFLLVIAFIAYFLYPTIKWYFMFNEEDRKEASYQGDALKAAIGDKVTKTYNDLKTFDKDDAYPAEMKTFTAKYKKEVKHINKANPVHKVTVSKNVTFKEMYETLLAANAGDKDSDKRRKEKYVDSFFRSALQKQYTKSYDAKKQVKRSIIKLGLDLQGGAYAVVEVNFDDPSVKEKYPKGISAEEKTAMIDNAAMKINNRINKFGLSETSIQKIKDQGKIIINLPGVKDTSELREIIETVGVLEFKVVSKEGSDMLAKLQREAAAEGKVVVDKDGSLLKEYADQLPADTQALYKSNKDEYGVESENRQMLVVEKESLLGENVKISSAAVQQGNLGQNVIGFTLEGKDADRWAEVTGANVGRQIAIILDNVILETPTVQEKITGGRSQITLGNAPIEHLQNIALILKTGSLNVPLTIAEENTVGASLGADTINKGLWACLWGITAVLIFMFLYYSVAGLIADCALILNLIFLMGGLALFNGTLTLPGIAGIVLTIGMAVDANVIIFERIKEEYRSGKTFKTSVNLGFQRAFWAIFDSNITTFFAGIGLSIFGTGALKGFAVTLCLGIVSSLYTALFVSKLIFDAMISGDKEIKTLRLLTFRGK
ncbi:MAG: protein translocase subunit SecD [Spirochaetales bacterium]|nr:protein translocase subunit SecD [Spirochaetales bacterium]MBR6199502.1 protein translocase subunit SecD [Spirochaetales bacterium]